MPCLAPSEFLTTDASSLIGAAAETLIEADYLTDVKRAGYFPAGTIDFADFSHGFGTTVLYIAYLTTNNPKLTGKELFALSVGGDLKIPDIMTHDTARRLEFYEIKPNSSSGRSAGRSKIRSIAAAIASTGLPYVPGIQYTPNKKRRFFSGLVLGFHLDVFFHFEFIAPGLIVYEFCFEGEVQNVPLVILLGILAGIVVVTFLPFVAGEGALVLA
jgi:hypothetical protein